ncbi:MAG: hypothetical protein PHH86_01345 [Sphaerochaetaceae bacterium]|nr:hypothetical protein [Sphaerochaetaceae bacterium]
MKPKIGLLPLYIKLYDEVAPDMRIRIEKFSKMIADTFISKEIEVFKSPICRQKAEFSKAINEFEKADVDVLVTLHLAYSPSLESITALLKTSLPIIVLDTTEDIDFGPVQSTEAILYNHGIHGVQDMCSLLVRHNRDFCIEAGHWKGSDVIDRVVHRIRGIVAAKAFSSARIGIIGHPFKGMGDFQLSEGDFEKELGIKTIQYTPGKDNKLSKSYEEEKAYLSHIGTLSSDIPEETLEKNIKILQEVRKWMDEEHLDGFTCNFLDVDKGKSIDRVPFLAAAVGMYEQYGYAGEGDILNAALVGSLLKINKNTTFTEMFCPDWRGGTIFLSHMGEINPRICDPPATFMSKDYGYSDAHEPIYATGKCMAGSAHIINIVTLADKKFRLIVVPVEVIHFKCDNFESSVRGWVKPKMPLERFLEAYSLAGGTHHSALIYADDVRMFETFAKKLSWELMVIDS